MLQCHRSQGRKAGYPECCIQFFIWRWHCTHGYPLHKPRNWRRRLWYRALQHYHLLVPTAVGFLPCPRHLLLIYLGRWKRTTAATPSETSR